MRKGLFDELLESVTEAKAIVRGRKAPSRACSAHEILHGQHPDVAALMKHFKLSQPKFAALLGISVDTLQNWEQKRRRPDGPAQVLLRIAATQPEALLAVSTGRPRRRGGQPAT
jgi:putative transcriptional regulator